MVESSSASKTSLKSVKKVEVRYGELVETVRAIVWRAEAPSFQVTYANKQAEDILGYPAESWVKERGFWQNHIHPDDREWVLALATRAIREERRHDFECRMLAADGRCIWLRNIFNVIGGDGLASELICLSVDITGAQAGGREIEGQRRAHWPPAGAKAPVWR